MCEDNAFRSYSKSFEPNPTGNPRRPEQFSNEVKIYFLGVPINSELEDPTRMREFENLLERARADRWQIYATSVPDYFEMLTPDGWNQFERTGQHLCVLRPQSHQPSGWNEIASSVMQIADNATQPIVLLRPGNPLLGDKLTEIFIGQFVNTPKQIEILEAKSGPDIVGDFAEKMMGLKNSRRFHIDGPHALLLTDSESLIGSLIIIRSLDRIYTDGNLFKDVLQKLIDLSLGDKQVFIKSQKTSGEILTVLNLLKEIDRFKPKDHYTLVVNNL
ncbi:MAG: hypothetical protein ACOZAN_03210 [Patescibacteria group bacterium]